MIEQLTPVDQPRLSEWTRRAINDPTVRATMWPTAYRPVEKKIPDNDWDKAYFMRKDDNDSLLALYPDRVRRRMSMSLWTVAGGRVETTAALWRYALLRAPKHFDCPVITFSVHDHNAAWIERLIKTFGRHTRWGVEPEGMYNSDSGRWEASHQFSVNVQDFLYRKGSIRHELHIPF